MLHTAVLLFGFTGIVGEYIKRNEALTGAGIVWWRMAITLLSLLLFPKIVKKVRAIPPRDRLKIMGIGLLVAAHWVTFFGAIQMTNASITISILASAAFFTSLIEPLLLKQKMFPHTLGILVMDFLELEKLPRTPTRKSVHTFQP